MVPQNFFCDQCDFKCGYEAALKKHTKEKHTHEGIQKSICTECGIQLSTPTDVKRHIKEVHSRAVTYPCSHCGKEFTKKANMKVHERIHTGEKPYMCNVCGQTFGGASNLYHHKKKHHPEEEEAKPCDGFDPEYQNAFSSSNSGDGLKGRPNKIKPKLQPSDPATIPDISQFANRIKQDLQFNNHGLNKQDFSNKDLSKIKQDFSNKNNFANNNQEFPSKQDFSNNKHDFPGIKQDYVSKQEYSHQSLVTNK